MKHRIAPGTEEQLTGFLFTHFAISALIADDHLVLVACPRNAQIVDKALLVRTNSTDLAVMNLGFVVLLHTERTVSLLRTLGRTGFA